MSDKKTDTSSLLSSVHCPLRPTFLIYEVSTFPRVSNESMIGEILSFSHLSAVSLARCEIWCCVRDIFYYTK